MIEELSGFKKPIRHCKVETGEATPREIVCGATNFVAGDRIARRATRGRTARRVRVGARKTYEAVGGHDLLRARARAERRPAASWCCRPTDRHRRGRLLGLRDDVIELEIPPDIGYAVDQGVAREVATGFGVAFRDPADVELPTETGTAWPASIADPTACDRFVLREVTGFDPAAQSPLWMRIHSTRAGGGSRPWAMSVRNYLMLELGQPLHAFDRGKLRGEIVVRRAVAGERLETLDHVVRELDPDDILITDQSGPISMAGTMGGLETEISDASTDIVIEAAHFLRDRHLARVARERAGVGVDQRFRTRRRPGAAPRRLAWRAMQLLAELGGASIQPGVTHAEVEVSPRASRSRRAIRAPWPASPTPRRPSSPGCSRSAASWSTATTRPCAGAASTRPGS